jgi:hypothetical protein
VLSVPTHPRGERPVAGKLPLHPEAEPISVGRTEIASYNCADQRVFGVEKLNTELKN